MKKRVFFNEDADNFGFICSLNGILPNEMLVKAFIDYYKDTSVTDFVLNVSCGVSTTESEIFESFMNKYEKSTEYGQPVDYKEHPVIKPYYHMYRTLGIDPYEIWVNSLWKNGINPWISFRMNDCHHDAFCTSEKNVTDRSIAFYREESNYFDITLDYTEKQIREKMLAYIREQLLKYDVYGIELDFDREPYCFPAGMKEKGRRIITDFFREIRAITAEISEKRCRKIKISVMCQANPIEAYNTGFDIEEIARLGLVDMVVACPRWETTNNDIPVKIWKKLLPKDVLFACKQEILIRPYTSYKSPNFPQATIDHALGQASAFHSMGADAVYVFNYFHKFFNKNDNLGVFQFSDKTVTSAKTNKRTLSLLGNTNEYRKNDLRFPLTYDDFINLHDKMRYSLPRVITPDEVQLFRIVTGKLEKGRKTYLILETEKEINPSALTVYANTKRATFLPLGKEDKDMFRKNTYTFAFDAEIDDCVEVDIIASEPCTLTFMEILAEKEF